jgi:hypothetical protein
MQANEVSELLKANPFEPLIVQLSDGRSFEIRRPGMAIVTPTMLAIGIAGANGSRLAERIVRCPLSEIANVEPVATTK